MKVMARKIPGFPSYRAGDNGYIYSYRVKGKCFRLHGTVTKKGYLTVTLRRDGRSFWRFVHRLVCEAFHGDPPTPKHQVSHQNGKPTDNAPTNLRWETARENHAWKTVHGTALSGERHPAAVLTNAKVREIRAELSAGVSQIEIAKKFGCSNANVSLISLGRAWKCVDDYERI